MKRAHTLTYGIAWSIANDTANRNMRRANRESWSQEDYDIAVDTFDRLAPHIVGWYHPSQEAV